MQAVILAGGFGTRLSEETSLKPKPMVEIGGKPLLWHILKIYSSHGINEFIICCGYKGYVIKEYFANYFLHTSDVTFDLKDNKIEYHQSFVEPWKITLLDTGLNTMTGGRLKRVAKYINSDTFCMTYGDGLSDVNITELIKFHEKNKSEATITAVKPPGRFGALSLEKDIHVTKFEEKPMGDNGWINGGFFVLNKSVIERIDNDDSIWEDKPLSSLAKDNKLSAYIHKGFWQPVDTLREKRMLEEAWGKGLAKWKIW
ncbi:glucose-1-phosphate cytidylyltransferase [Prochlorococcus sp. AH-736-K20]|nr:glucose-1-phosphate cytidylyltransferase [Prochlorococcus sp. AH-736-K20]MDA9746545.1 glucose-1-phosphate cytidylyltransferase [Prochlorococcus sp. AH-736-K20]